MKKLAHTCQYLKTSAQCPLFSNEWLGSLYLQKARSYVRQVCKYTGSVYSSQKTVHFFSLIFLGGFQYNSIPFLHSQAQTVVEKLQHFLLLCEKFSPECSFLLSPRIFQLCSTSSCEEKYLLSRLVSVEFFKALSKTQLLFSFESTSALTLHI